MEQHLLKELRRLALIIFSLGIILFGTLAYAQHSADKAINLAEQANRKAISGQLVQEKVCSQNNQGAPCRDLFERLKNSLSEQQRFELGCDSLAYLKLPQLDALRAKAHCPPTPAPNH